MDVMNCYKHKTSKATFEVGKVNTYSLISKYQTQVFFKFREYQVIQFIIFVLFIFKNFASKQTVT